MRSSAGLICTAWASSGSGKAATVQALADDGPAEVLVSLALGGTPLLARITRKSAAALALAPGQRVFAQIKGVAVLD